MPRFARVSLALGLLVMCSATAARADVPPPEGLRRIDYRVQVTGGGPGVAIVAYPTYVSEGGSVAVVKPDQELRFVQGYRPGIYSLPAEDAAALVGKSGEEVDRALAAKGRVCVEKVPRVFTVATDTKITAMTDIVEIVATPTSCRATLARTRYGGENGEAGEGTIDASGRRRPPAPFSDKDLEVVTELGFTPGPANGPAPGPAPVEAPPQKQEAAAPAPVREGPPAAEKAGCSIGGDAGAGRALALLALLAAVRGRRRRR